MKPKKVDVMKSSLVSLPEDCLCQLSSFLLKSSTAINLIGTCKALRSFFLSDRFYSGFPNVVFNARLWALVGFCESIDVDKIEGIEDWIPEKTGHIRKLCVDYCSCPEDILIAFLKKFPKIESLDVSNIEATDDSVLKDLMLKELNISGCWRVNGACFENSVLSTSLESLSITGKNKGSIPSVQFSKLKNLKTVRFLHDSSFMLNSIKLTSKFLSHFSQVEEVFAVQHELEEGKPFQHLKRLKVLDISRCNSNTRSNINDKMIEDLENLESLKMKNIQYFKNKDPKVIGCGAVTWEGFRKMKKLRFLDLSENWILGPEILECLTSLEVLNVANTNEKMVEAAIKLNQLKKLNVCLCIDPKPKKKEYKIASLECKCSEYKPHYTCNECQACPRCKTVMKNCNIRRCVDCNIDFCEKCRKSRAGGCENCAESFCGCQRKTKYFAPYCNCEWEVLCTKCINSSFFSGSHCEGTIKSFKCPCRCCHKCLDGCDTCGKRYCFEHQFRYFQTVEDDIERIGKKTKCRVCKKVICKTGPDCCLKCVTKIHEKAIREKECGECQSCGFDLCKECTSARKACPLCKKLVCFKKKENEDEEESGCIETCPMCKKLGCRKCLELFVSEEEYYYSVCDECDERGCGNCQNELSYCSMCEMRKCCANCAKEKFTLIHGDNFCPDCVGECGKCSKQICRSENYEECEKCGGTSCDICETFICKDCTGDENCDTCELSFCKDCSKKHDCDQDSKITEK